MSSGTELLDKMPLTTTELIAELTEIEQRMAVAALAIRRLETVGAFGLDGSVTTAAWLRQHGRMSDGDARKWVRRGRLLDRFTAIADAAVERDLSLAQLDVLQHLYKPKFESLLADHQRGLVESVAALDVEGTVRVCAHWKARAEAIVNENEPPAEPERSLTMGRAGDGALVGRFTLDDAAATEFEKAIRNASTYEGKDDTRSAGRRNGDAVMDIAAYYNKNHEGDGTPRHLPSVTISVDASTMETHPEGMNDDDQRPMSAACTDTYLCDCVIHAILRDADGAPQGFGRSRYTVPRPLFRQVAARDGGCRFPGCNRKVRHCDAHHIKYWRRFGTTDYANLVLLCSRHHHIVHRLELQLKLLPNAELHVTWHDGRERISQPRGAPPKRAST